MDFIIEYVLVAGLFLAVDSVWLIFIAKSFYQREIGGLLLKKARLVPAAVFYALYVLGMVVFALDPALSSGSWTTAVVHGGLLGLVMYATYDLTNASTLKGWSSKVTLVDLLWGTFATALTVTLAYLIVS